MELSDDDDVDDRFSMLEMAHEYSVRAEKAFRMSDFEDARRNYEFASEKFKSALNEEDADRVTKNAIEMLFKDVQRKIKMLTNKEKKSRSKHVVKRKSEASVKKPASPKRVRESSSKESSKKQVWSAFESLKTLETKLGDLGRSLREITPIHEDVQPVLSESFMVIPASKTSRKRKPLDSILEETKRAHPNELRRRLGQQEKEIRRLLKTIDRLNRENTLLIRDCQSTARIRRENDALRAQMKHFRQCYRNQFSALKLAMEEMKRNMMTEDSVKTARSPTRRRVRTASPRNRRIDESLLMMSSAHQLDFPFAASVVNTL